ncbi:hypothetical protein SO802_010964 [Lithocarpus litseifolius]|uniref:Transmembrane protein n=1 Tax=Lithocarpus litseifolius TaxID=425828 RepID=A0AAW2DG70_9ROSI
MVFAVLGNGFDRRGGGGLIVLVGGGGGGGFGICWSVVVTVVLGSGFDYRFMGLLEIGLSTGVEIYVWIKVLTAIVVLGTAVLSFYMAWKKCRSNNNDSNPGLELQGRNCWW